MRLEAIKVFCDLINSGSFSKAAEVNAVSQPTVTRFIHQLEERLGGELVDRSKRPLQPTALGRAYHEGCKSLLEQFAELESTLRRGQGERTLTVRVAAIYSVGLGDMGHYVERFQQEHPNAKVQMEYLHPDQRVRARARREDQADIGLVSFPARAHASWTVLPWREEPMVLVVCAAAHPLGEAQAPCEADRI